MGLYFIDHPTSNRLSASALVGVAGWRVREITNKHIWDVFVNEGLGGSAVGAGLLVSPAHIQRKHQQRRGLRSGKESGLLLFNFKS